MHNRFRSWLADRDFDMMHIEHMRNVIKRSRELLANTPVPDTFLGRKTPEPSPPLDQETRIANWMASKELQPPK